MSSWTIVILLKTAEAMLAIARAANLCASLSDDFISSWMSDLHPPFLTILS
jgi:hypothetical protein